MRMIDMAFRNIFRNTRRSLLAATSVFLAMLMVMVLQGFMDGFLDSMIRNYTKTETGHVSIVTSSYRERARFVPVDEYIEDSDRLAARAAALLGGGPRVRIAQRIRFGVLIAHGENSRRAMVVAGDPETERDLLMLDSRIVPGGRYAAEPGGAIVGHALAASLGLKPGDELRLVTSRADGGLGLHKLNVTGLFRTGVNSMDDAMVQIPLVDARALLGMEGGAQQLMVMLPDSRGVDRATKILREGLGGAGAGSGQELSILPWNAIGEYPKIIMMAGSVYFWMFVFIAFLGAFIIANVMTMVVLERRREIGILKSMGMPPRRILALFLGEGAMLGAAGAFAGCLAGWLVTLALGKIGLDMSGALSGFTWPLDNVIYPRVSPLSMPAFTALGTAASAIVAYLPARKAARMEPVRAIRAA